MTTTQFRNPNFLLIPSPCSLSEWTTALMAALRASAALGELRVDRYRYTENGMWEGCWGVCCGMSFENEGRYSTNHDPWTEQIDPSHLMVDTSWLSRSRWCDWRDVTTIDDPRIRELLQPIQHHPAQVLWQGALVLEGEIQDVEDGHAAWICTECGSSVEQCCGRTNYHVIH